MELSRIEYRRLVEDVAEAVLAKVLPFVKKRRAEKPEEQWTWVSAEEAAKIVGLTKNYLLRQKAYFTHVKIGKAKACRVMFRTYALFALPQWQPSCRQHRHRSQSPYSFLSSFADLSVHHFSLRRRE